MKSRVKDNPAATPEQVRSLAKRDLHAALRHPNLPLDLLEKHWIRHYDILKDHPAVPLLLLEDLPRWQALHTAKAMATMGDRLAQVHRKVMTSPQQLRMTRRVMAFVGTLASRARRINKNGGFFSSANVHDADGIRMMLQAAITPRINEPTTVRDAMLPSTAVFFSPKQFGVGNKAKVKLVDIFRSGLSMVDLLGFLEESLALYEQFIDGKVAWLERAIDKRALPQDELLPMLVIEDVNG